jgi:hypothetical protein
MEQDSKRSTWRAGEIMLPASLEVFPRRLRRTPDAGVGGAFPRWGDVAAVGLGWSDYPEAGTGLALRQAVRRATPLPPGLAVNLIGAQRGLHPAGVADGASAVVEAWERGLLRPGTADVRFLDWQALPPSNLAALARACGDLAAEGLLSVVWPVLDDVVLASVRERRMIAGTAEVVEAIRTLLPEVVAAVAAGTAAPSVLDLPGVRALAERSGASRAVTLARAVVSVLPVVVAVVEAASEPVVPTGPAFDEVWPEGAGALPAVVDGATITASWHDPSAPSKMVALNLDLPGESGGPYYVVKGWFYDLEREGQCEAVSAAMLADPNRPGWARYRGDSWLRWDADLGRLVVAADRGWVQRGGEPAPPPHGPLTTSMAAVLLAGLCHDDSEIHAQRTIFGAGLVGSAAVTVAVRALFDQPVISPGRMIRPLDGDATLLPVLWPVLVESVRHAAAQQDGLPRWLNRVLDTALLHAPLLREAASRGLLPADQASWPGLVEIAGRKGSSAALTKARALRDALGLVG